MTFWIAKTTNLCANCAPIFNDILFHLTRCLRALRDAAALQPPLTVARSASARGLWLEQIFSFKSLRAHFPFEGGCCVGVPDCQTIKFEIENVLQCHRVLSGHINFNMIEISSKIIVHPLFISVFKIMFDVVNQTVYAKI
jgi:hypothetical protein